MIVQRGRRNGRLLQSLSYTVTWAFWSCLVLAAHSRSRGSCKLHKFKSPTWAPSTIDIRQVLPAGILIQSVMLFVGSYFPCSTGANRDCEVLAQLTARITNVIVEC